MAKDNACTKTGQKEAPLWAAKTKRNDLYEQLEKKRYSRFELKLAQPKYLSPVCRTGHDKKKAEKQKSLHLHRTKSKEAHLSARLDGLDFVAVHGLH
jgi:hypothetical protein